MSTVEAMPLFAALLRGIAPSGMNMTNDKLRGVFEDLGLEAVASVLSSGNIVFRSSRADAPALEQRIEDALALELGISSRTLLRSYSDLRALVDSDPFPGVRHHSTTYLTATFIKDPSARELAVAGRLDPGTTVVRYDPVARAIVANTDNSQPDRARGFMLWLEQSYGRGITTRSWPTFERIVKKLETVDPA